MYSFIEKTRKIFAKYAQVLFVLLAFALMVVSSYIILSESERSNMRKNAENAILYTEANIKSDMLEPETLLGGISETICLMICNGGTKEQINDYIAYINDYVWESENRLLGVQGFYGVFDVFNGVMMIGSDTWIPPDDYDLENRLWRTGAIEAAGGISTTEPYLNIYSNEITITLSRRIFDEDGNALGIICMNIELDRIKQYAINTRFAEDGYGFLLSRNLIIIAHPDSTLVGMSYRDFRSDIAEIIDVFEQSGKVSEISTTDYRGIESIIFINGLYNGWYMGVVTPVNSYFQSTRNLIVVLVSLGTIFAAFLIWMLLRISFEKASSDERMQIMFDVDPFPATLFDRNFNIIDCNKNALKMFEVSSKEEFAEKFFDLMPEYQPDGELSKDRSFIMLHKALEEGYNRFEIMHRTINEEPIPCEITLVRVKYKNDFIAVGYIRDLREQKKMTLALEQNARLLDTVNTAASILLANSDINNFETSLLKCFDLIGHCLDVDRVQIWRNEHIDGNLHFVLRYEWLSDYGKKCKTIPIGQHFPYSMKKNWENWFSKNIHINAPVSKLFEEDQAFLGNYEMKSIVIIPMFLDGNFWGFFSISDCRSERRFSDEEINILTSAGLMMSSAVNRNVQALKMRETEERTQIMIDAAPLSAIFWDKNLVLVDCNQEAVNMFGLSSKQEFISRFISLSPEYQPDGVSSVEKGGRLVRKAFEEGYSRFEWMHQKADGEPIPADVTCIRVKHKDEYTVTEYIRDLREQKAMIAEMRKAEIAEESSKAKSDFLAKMSHEIRTPMNAILGITEIQLQDETHPPLTREAFERIYNSSDLLLGIINDILDLSKIEAGKLILIPAQYDIASLINDTVQLILMRYESRTLEFSLDVNEDIPLILIGDELRIKQILNNILSNAFKYTTEGMVSLTVFAEPENKENSSKRTIVFIIKDTGQGMTPEQVRKIGTEYSRFNMEANRTTEGTGLGMNITRNLIQLMGGSLSIESTPGVGSLFTVRLPQDCVGSNILGKELADNLMQLNIDSTMKIRTMQMNKDFMPYGRVLVVDDVETNLYVARGLMAPYGLSIDTVMSGFEAVDKIRDGISYDIIFMDHMMPRMDGIEATKIIRSLGYRKPIIALTANALAGQAEMFLENGLDDFISKPIDIRQLNLILNKYIRDKYPDEVLEAAKQQRNRLYGGVRKKETNEQLAEVFVRDAKKTLAILEGLYINKLRRSDDISVFIINIHAMKSALANIGETELSAKAATLEKAGREQNTKLILSELPPFLELLFSAVKRLEPESETPGGDADDIPFLKEKLLIIKTACEFYDRKTAKEALADIKQRKWSHKVKKQIDAISEHLLHSDFEEIIKEIGEIG